MYQEGDPAMEGESWGETWNGSFTKTTKIYKITTLHHSFVLKIYRGDIAREGAKTEEETSGRHKGILY